MRRTLCCLAAALCVLLPIPAARAGVPVLVVDGRGFGHGVGMAQDGAFWMGAAGASTNQILGQFYPGTSISRRSGAVRVAVLSVDRRQTTITFPEGGEVRDAPSGGQSPGFPLVVAPGGQVSIWFDGAYHAQQVGGPPPPRTAAAASRPQVLPLEPTTTTTPEQTTPTTEPTLLPPAPTTTELPTTTTSPPPADGQPPPPQPPAAGPVVTSGRPLVAVPRDNGTVAVDARGRRYRGTVEANAAAGPLRLINQLDVETYLKGMGEVRDPRWPAASLRTQAIAARTYALRAMAKVGELCDDQRCQVYLGSTAEYAAMNKAVDQSRGQVLSFHSQLVSAVYSANGGGFSASTEEGFGTPGGDYPYLRASRYLTKDPKPWTVRIALADLAARFGYPGQLSGAHISKAGPSGRALEVSLDGNAGPRAVPGLQFDAALGLRSTLFTLRVEEADVAPPPPAAEGLIQALPDQAPTPAAPEATTTTSYTTRPRRATLQATAAPTGTTRLPSGWTGLASTILLGVGAALLASAIKDRGRGTSAPEGARSE